MFEVKDKLNLLKTCSLPQLFETKNTCFLFNVTAHSLCVLQQYF